MKENSRRPVNREILDPKPPVIQCGRMEDRKKNEEENGKIM